MNIHEELITINRWSRPGNKLKAVKGIVVHWIGNANTSAKSNRDWFESLKDSKKTFASAHYIIGLHGEIIRCIPDDEIAYHVGSKTYTDIGLKVSSYPNNSLIGIECCHTDWDGNMTAETVRSLKELLKYLCETYKLNPKTDIYTHKEIVGWKPCHKYYVDNPEKFIELKQEISDKMNNLNWKQKIIQEALNLGLLTDKEWLDRVDQPATVWLCTALAINIYKKLKK